MTRNQLKRMKARDLRNLGHEFGLPVCRDFTKSDLVDMLADRMTDDAPEPLEEPLGHAATRACENSGQ